jgi:hypothetical protein
MAIFNKKVLTPSIALLSSALALSHCGSKDGATEVDPNLTDTQNPGSTTPSPSPSPTPSSSASSTSTSASASVAPTQFFTASNTMKVIAAYNYAANGTTTFSHIIDLTSYIASGSITSLTFLTKDVLIATVDPGASGEQLVRIDLSGNTVSSVTPGWYSDATNLNNIAMNKVVKWSSSKLIALKQTTSAEAISYDLTSNVRTRLGAPFIATTVGSCTIQTLQVGIPVVATNWSTKLLAASSGATPRLFLYDGIDGTRSCLQAYDPTTALGITSAHVQTGMVQLSNGKVYVRYQHTSTPMIAQYDYSGASISNPVKVFSDTAVLNTTTTDRELIAINDSNLLFSNWSTDAVYKLDLNTSSATPIVRDYLSVDVTAIAVRPAQ